MRNRQKPNADSGTPVKFADRICVIASPHPVHLGGLPPGPSGWRTAPTHWPPCRRSGPQAHEEREITGARFIRSQQSTITILRQPHFRTIFAEIVLAATGQGKQSW